jgi:hypothetical protein
VDLYPDWIEFLQEVADSFWPCDGKAPQQRYLPKDKRPEGSLCDPDNAISTILAALVSAGTLSPKQVMEMDEQQKNNYNSN